MDQTRYSAVAAALHWALAILLLAQIAGGFYMHNLPNTAPMKFDLYQLHKSFGLSIFVLTLFRLGWRLAHRPPALPATTPGWQRLIARTIHWLFYGLMLATPLLGLAIVSVSPKDIPTEWFGLIPVPHLGFLDPGIDPAATEHNFIEIHEVLSFAILGLLALHVAAALKHGFINRDGVLQSMAPSPRALLVAGVIFAVLAAGVFTYFVSKDSVSVVSLKNERSKNAITTTPQTDMAQCETAVSANWDINYSNSTLRFVGEENGRELEGRFSDFTAEIAFSDNDLANSWIRVRVDMASAATGDELIDSTLPGGEWFDVNAHPAALFQSCDIRRSGDNTYEARGVLAVKSSEQPVTLPFKLEIDGDDASASGGVDLIRTDFDLGAASSWLDEEGVALEARIEFTIEATRAN